MEPAPLSAGFQSLPLLPTIKLGHSGAGSRVGWLVHALDPCGSLQRPPVRLGVSPAAAPTPMGVFNQRFGAVFPAPPQPPAPCWSPGLRGLLRSPPFIPVYLCVKVGPRGATRCSACPVLRHSESDPLVLSV